MSQQEASNAFHDALVDDDPVELYERAPCGYLSTTPDGRIVKANQTFLTWTGYSAEDLDGRTFAHLLTVGGRIYHETHYAPMLRMQGSVREIAVDIRRKGADRLPVLVNAVLDRSPDGTPRIVRIALFDATERRNYERELLRAKDAAEAAEDRARTLARTLQQTLIPPTPPHIPGLEVAAAYRPAGDGSEVGGDFYDVFPLGPDDWVVVLGDVCGKGAEAAVVTALARYSLRALSVAEPGPGAVLEQLNEIICAHETDRFCTVTVARLRRSEGRWCATFGTGGHPPPLLVRGGAAPVPVDVHGPLVGVMEGSTYPEHELPLEAGDTLLLYTDGVTEARGAEDFYGEERLEKAVDRLSSGADVLVPSLLAEVMDFQSGVPRDDIALLAITVPA